MDEDERVYYDWLIRGLLDGGRRIIGVPGYEETLSRTLAMVEELLLELTVRIADTPVDIDREARRLENRLVESLVLEAAAS